MRIQLGDTVILNDRTRDIGIVERRHGNTLSIRRPDRDNLREQVAREHAKPLALAMAEARERESKFRNDLSLTGQSTLADLVSAFGYATAQLRRDSLARVVRQLQRAGLEVQPSSEEWSRHDNFALQLKATVGGGEGEGEGEETETAADYLTEGALPEPFWPCSLGLGADAEVAFLRALTAREPILALLHLSDDAQAHGWLQGTWEGLMAWAYRAAQRFVHTGTGEFLHPEVQVGPAALLHAYLKPSKLSDEGPRLQDGPRHLNLVALKQDSDSPVDFQRLKAAWPGPVFEFKGAAASATGAPVVQLLLQVGGTPEKVGTLPAAELSPLKLLLWAREASAQVLAQGSTRLGALLADGPVARLKGSNESATSLALKAHLAAWVRERLPDAELRFEDVQVEQFDEEGRARKVSRADLKVEDEGVYEVESLSGSGPMEAFYHQKVFSRLKGDVPFHLVVPNEALLWAGPFLADIAHHLGERGRVLVPGAGHAYLALQGRALAEEATDIDAPEEAGRKDLPFGPPQRPTEEPLRLKGIAGYGSVKERIARSILWPERHRSLVRGLSRASGILFFGPPGCGKSRLARAIAGELEQEVRLLSPADLRGPYIGWGQVMIREQFDWVAERERRMLVIDELDAVARSRRSREMHSDEKADVNELLVQLDRVSRMGRLVVGTTNFIGSLDEAVVRSGRFGLYVPVPPPDADEAVEIMGYYLARLTPEVGGSVTVSVPQADALRAALLPLFAENVQAGTHFCGADLEAAVNDTFLRCLQRAVEGAGEMPRSMAVTLPVEELARSLAAGPRSVSALSLRRFLKEARRYCGHDAAEALARRFAAADVS
ncbi:ATP-binding protein [Aggregicoccus sp. 17bor-14]|uniref:AAA family ATPase n=1 Tax=Myxococcaceae TaxID=31 RepID=UPI00129CC04F|nr:MULTISPECIES: ATP-binding protein [Myxococcaceae]MBF5043173.1 ATP-binding protein [Simulacricoccus sp. 17bor-14]MRI88931.1 ATP-binding protein [Aggregicoccus sp. 17bor-14]